MGLWLQQMVLELEAYNAFPIFLSKAESIYRQVTYYAFYTITFGPQPTAIKYAEKLPLTLIRAGLVARRRLNCCLKLRHSSERYFITTRDKQILLE